MRLINNNISPLPFYDDIKQQNHRKDYAFGNIYQLITYKNNILPFQVCVDNSFSVISKVYLYNVSDGAAAVLDITQAMDDNGLSVKQFDDFNLIKFPGGAIQEIAEGLYYIQIVSSNNINLYSDIFNVCNDVSDYIQLEYYNSYNFEIKNGIVDFSDGFKFKCYLNSQIGKPEYTFEEEATERMGYTFVESQVSKKIYKFTVVAPEYLCDALRIVRLCENKRITSKSNDYDLTSFELDIDWQDQGDIAAIECSFETDTVIVNIGGYSNAVNIQGSPGYPTISLTDLSDTNILSVQKNEILAFNGRSWVNKPMPATGLDETALASYLSANNYAKKSDIPSLTGYATEQWVREQKYVSKTDFDSFKELFDSMFEKVVEDGKTSIKAKFGLWTDYFLSAYGQNGDGGSGTVTPSVTTLNSLTDVTLTAVQNGQALVYRNGAWVNEAIATGLDETALASYLSANNYAKKSDIPSLARYVTTNTPQEISATKTFTAGLRVSGRAFGGGDDEGIVIGKADNGFAALTLGVHNGARSVFYLGPTNDAYWRWSDNTNFHDIYHPKKSGTIALTSDITASLADYVTTDTAQTITGIKTFEHSIAFNVTEPNGGRTNGISGSINGSAVGSVGFLCDNNVYQGAYIGWGPNPWIYSDNLFVSQNQLTYKNNAILHGGNYASMLDSRYVNAAGDTMNGALELRSYLFFTSPTSRKGLYFTTDESGNVSFSQHVNNTWTDSAFMFHNGGTFYAKGIAVASDALVSNLNADLLDGYHEISFVRSWWTYEPGYDCDTYNGRPLISFTYHNNAPFTGAFIDVNTNGYGFYLGTQYGIDSSLYYRRHGTSADCGMGAWQQLARITDNVASATKLQTARTIWGQSFDGSGNVTGNMESVDSIYMSGYVLNNKNGQYLSVLDYHNDGSLALNYGLAMVKGLPCTIYGNTNIKGDLYADGMMQSNASASDSAKMRVNCGNTSILTLEANANGRGLYDTTLQKYMWWFDGQTVFTNYDGNYGIGTTSPTTKLHVNGNIRANGSLSGVTSLEMTGSLYGATCIELFHTTPFIDFHYGYSTADFTSRIIEATSGTLTLNGVLTAANGGNVGVKTSSPVYDLDVNGVIHASDGIWCNDYISAYGLDTSSDERLKDIVQDFTLGIADIANAPSVIFRWKKDGTVDVGSIAQYWQKILPQMAHMMPNGFLGLDYGKAALMSAISLARTMNRHEERLNTHDEEIRRLKEENRQLREENRQLREELQTLKYNN